jgi:sugar/nucleoside kinase (ribokinase family)
MNSIEKAIDVVVIGELNVDIIFNEIAGFPAVGKEIIANNMSVTLGSSSAIFASNLSSLGIHVSFIGKVGDDTFAHVVLAALTAKGVDTDHIVRSAVLNTGVTIVLNYDQDRANVTYPGAM